MKIDSAKSEKVKYIIRLQQKARFRKKEGLFVCEGERLVREVPPALLEEVYVAEGAQFAPKTEAWLSNMRGGGATVHILGEAAYQRVSEVVHPQGILALARMPERWEPLADEAGTAPLLLFLENLQDPGNLGTILRAAEAAG
ncbi:MAG: 23S rRNA (guanosine(2251)-2'-O)-methyltransferase RlmB, partial [Lachnospiraceae bacterium]|nr:23S rRNA (guanosine(2251)-2'-O)-methyltransferase RlmB [Lachnospiraceae bacterium]